jgi:crotonobetainyl-CoA:carnitine CoA-transferase CaiB-like acyl-CoA transferase
VKGTALRPLEGLLAVEVGDLVAAQYCGQLLASLGARVIRVDEPGETGRQHQAGFMPGSVTPEGAIRRLHLAAGKQSATIRYSGAEGAALLRRLVARADVLVEGVGPEPAGRLGLGFAELHGLYPELVVGSLSWFGHDGPYSGYRATDLTCSALSGYVYLNGSATGAPLNLPAPLGQYMAGLSAAIGICALLLAGQGTGPARHLDVSVQEALAIQLAGAATDAVRTGNNTRRAGNRMVARNGGRTYTAILPCADGYVVVALVGEADYLRLADLGLAVGDLPEQARQRPGSYPDEVDRLIAPWLASRGREQVAAEVNTVGLHWSEVLSPGEATRTPQAQARRVLGHYDHPLFGSLPFVEVPVRAGRGDDDDGDDNGDGGDPAAFRLLGADNEAVLTGDLGLSPDDVRALVANGVV